MYLAHACSVSKLKQRQGETDEEYALREADRLARKRESSRRRRKDPVVREADRLYRQQRLKDPAIRQARREENRAYMRAKYHDPAEIERRKTDKVVEMIRRKNRDSERRKRALPPDHPGTCDLCGVHPPLMRNGARGLQQDHRHDNNVIRGYLCSRCNRNVSSLDLAFTDPDYFAKLKAWSLKGAPVVPVRSRQPQKRCRRPPDRGLFD